MVRTSRYSIDEVSYVSLNCKAQEEVLSRTCLRLCMQVLCRAARSAQATLSTLLGNVVSKSHVLYSYTYIYSQYTLRHNRCQHMVQSLCCLGLHCSGPSWCSQSPASTMAATKLLVVLLLLSWFISEHETLVRKDFTTTKKASNRALSCAY